MERASQRLKTLPGLSFGMANVRGPSMEPTLHDGDKILLSYDAPAVPGALAIVRLPAQDDGTPRPVAVKRLARKEGDGWWIERDNAETGVDSWQVGAIPENDVIAVVVARLWPHPSRLQDHPDAPGQTRG